MIQNYDDAVDAIDAAADETRAQHGLSNKSKIDHVRQNMMRAELTEFDSSRGATKAGKNFEIRFENL